MKIGLALRVSLLSRMLVALAVLATFSLAVALVTGLLGGLLGLYALGALDYVASLPRVSTHLPVPAWLVFAVAAPCALGTFFGWSLLLEPRFGGGGPAAVATGIGLLASLYLAVVEGAAALAAILVTSWGVRLIVLGCAVLAVAGTVIWARGEIRALRDRLVDDSVPARDAHPGIDSTARRLAALADVPAPDVYVTERDRPESFTVGTGESAVVVVSTGAIDALSDDELEAVLAHEVSHLANGDSRIVAAALAPVLIADDWIEDDPDELFDYLWNAWFGLLRLYGQFGVAVLSRGREWGADAGAAALTGSPAALASALATLDGERRTPEVDLRDWEERVAAIDILPPTDRGAGTGPFRTHPSTDDRIDRLRSLAARAEDSREG